jgi:hypothetical protein
METDEAAAGDPAGGPPSAPDVRSEEESSGGALASDGGGEADGDVEPLDPAKTTVVRPPGQRAAPQRVPAAWPV